MMVANPQALISPGDCLAWAAMAAVTAVEEVNPPKSPVRPNPLAAPRNLAKKYPTKLIPDIKMTRKVTL